MREVLALDVERVLELGEDDVPPLMECKAVVVRDRRLLSSILKQLSNASLPPHLKRLRHCNKDYTQVVLLTAEEAAQFSANEQDLVSVPICAPLTLYQVTQWTLKYWPVCFSNKQAAPPTLMPSFPPQELQRLEAWLEQSHHFPVQIIDPRNNTCLARMEAGMSNTMGIAHPIMLALEASAQVVQQSKNAEDYLCTGMDVFLLHEPCIMCAMALLHSRVSRVFFHHASEQHGAIASVCRLHTLPSINHRYRVFHYSSSSSIARTGEKVGKCF